MQLFPQLGSSRTATRRQIAAMLAALTLLASSTMQPAFYAAAQSPTAQAQSSVAAPPPSVQQNQERTVAVILIKNAILAVNQGNLTGNYTVLRDLASPGFRERNSAADLAAIFQNIRQQKFDLSPIVVLDPVLNQPRIDPEGQLILEGRFDSKPLRINFRLAFLKANSNGWMIHGVSLNAVPEAPAPAAPVAERVMQTSGTYR